MSIVQNECVLGELTILGKIVYRHSNQHGKTKYYQRLKHVRSMMRNFLLALQNPVPITLKQYDELLDVLLSTAEIYTVLLGQSYFMPLAITVLAVISRLVGSSPEQTSPSTLHPACTHGRGQEQSGW